MAEDARFTFPPLELSPQGKTDRAYLKKAGVLDGIRETEDGFEVTLRRKAGTYVWLYGANADLALAKARALVEEATKGARS